MSSTHATFTSADLEASPCARAFSSLYSARLRNLTDAVHRDLVIGSFLESVPENDVYVIKWCLHNWMDEHAIKILRVIRRAIQRTERSRLVLFEYIVEEGYPSHLAWYADTNVLVAVNGLERSLDKWTHLAEKSGWSVSRVFRLRNVWSAAIGMVPAWEEEMNGVKAFLTISGDVTTKMTLIEPWDECKGNPYFRSAADPGFDSINFKWEDYNVKILDVRPNKHAFSLDSNEFVYLDNMPETAGPRESIDVRCMILHE